MNKEELDLLEIVFTLALGECAYNDINNIQKLEDKIKTIGNLCKKQKEVINKAMSILKDNFVYDYVRSCDTTDGVGYDEIDTEHFTYRVYEMLKEVSE